LSKKPGSQCGDGEIVTDFRCAASSAAARQLIYDTTPIGLAFLFPDGVFCKSTSALTEICRISVEDHLGRAVRDCVPTRAKVGSRAKSSLDRALAASN
jgi:hypothetical protein